jgi:hypothetical protein
MVCESEETDENQLALYWRHFSMGGGGVSKAKIFEYNCENLPMKMYEICIY